MCLPGARDGRLTCDSTERPGVNSIRLLSQLSLGVLMHPSLSLTSPLLMGACAACVDTLTPAVRPHVKLGEEAGAGVL